MSDSAQSQVVKTKTRLLKLLSKAGADGMVHSLDGSKFLLVFNTRTFAFEIAAIKSCIDEKLIKKNSDRLFLTAQGKAHLVRALHLDQEFTAQHQAPVAKTIHQNGSPHQVMMNMNESPLARLYLRRAKSGKPWLNDQEFQAGERLRADFEKSQLQPRISANWVSSIASNGRSGNLSADISDFALDARKRVEAAIGALGPDLANVALDICCFLKGLETIEREHLWPPRSAKLMLRTALRELARHYGLGADHAGKTHVGSIKHWGVDGFRPSI